MQNNGVGASNIVMDSAVPVFATNTDCEWDDPSPLGVIQTPEIRVDLLPGWLGEYVQAVSKSTQTPPAMAVMMGLSVVATCVQKKFEVSPFGIDYSEPLCLWTLTVMPPASRKSAVTSAMTAPLLEWECEQAEKTKDEISKRTATRMVTQKRIDKLELDAAKKEDPHDRQRIIEEVAELRKNMPDEIRTPQLWTADVTPERLQGLLVEHDEKMSLLSDEGGIFEILAGLYSNGQANIDIFLKAHAGGAVRVDRAGRSAYLDKPALTLGLAVQPQILSDMGQGSKKRFRGLGALARFLYVIPESNIGQRNVRQNFPVPDTVKSAYRAGIFQLLEIQPTQDGKDHPFILTLSPGALECFQTFQEFIERNQGPSGEYEPIQDWTGKLPGAALRIAGLFHVVLYGAGSFEIGLSEMEAALDLAEALIPHAQIALSRTAADKGNGGAQRVLDWIIEQGEESFTRGECHSALRGSFPTVERLIESLVLLQDHNFLSDPASVRKGQGRPSIVHKVNPKVFEEGSCYGVA